jgi:hypothetical protein
MARDWNWYGLQNFGLVPDLMFVCAAVGVVKAATDRSAEDNGFGRIRS